MAGAARIGSDGVSRSMCGTTEEGRNSNSCLGLAPLLVGCHLSIQAVVGGVLRVVCLLDLECAGSCAFEEKLEVA